MTRPAAAPQAWELTGDAYSTHPGDKPWISEMYGYSFGAAKADVWHTCHHTAMLYPGYDTTGMPCLPACPTGPSVAGRALSCSWLECVIYEATCKLLRPLFAAYCVFVCSPCADVPTFLKLCLQSRPRCCTTACCTRSRGPATSLTSTGTTALTRSSARRGSSQSKQFGGEGGTAESANTLLWRGRECAFAEIFQIVMLACWGISPGYCGCMKWGHSRTALGTAPPGCSKKATLDHTCSMCAGQQNGHCYLHVSHVVGS
jgi:hypothetical protein